jgi:hypothetical protein
LENEGAEMKAVKRAKRSVAMFQKRHPKIVKGAKAAGKLAPLLLG